MLPVHEELFLLALDEDKGNILPFAKKTIYQAIIGGILAELVLMGKVCSNEKHRLELLDNAPTGDQILDAAINDIQSSDKQRKLTFWINKFGFHPKELREDIGNSLVAKGLLIREEKSFLWPDPSAEVTLPSARSKFEMKIPLRAMILSTAESNHHDLALLNIASATGLLGLIFTQDELHTAKQCIHETILRTALENPVMQTIEEIEQAILSSMDDTD
jgi:hypothetical protein